MRDTTVKPGDVLTITRSIRSQKTGLLLPTGNLRQRDREPSRQLTLVNFECRPGVFVSL
jgi:hypothetical protein